MGVFRVRYAVLCPSLALTNGAIADEAVTLLAKISFLPFLKWMHCAIRPQMRQLLSTPILQDQNLWVIHLQIGRYQVPTFTTYSLYFYDLALRYFCMIPTYDLLWVERGR